MKFGIPDKYQSLWALCIPLLKKGRPDDYEHSKEVMMCIIKYSKDLSFDIEILLPVAMMHDIGHSAILNEHFKYVSGSEKLVNAKLVHMLAGAKIADDLLRSVKYDPIKAKEIVEIISTHDADQLANIDINKFYDTTHKKIFHDLDALDRFNERRVKDILPRYGNDLERVFAILEKSMSTFFSEDIKLIAKEELEKMRNSMRA